MAGEKKEQKQKQKQKRGSGLICGESTSVFWTRPDYTVEYCNAYGAKEAFVIRGNVVEMLSQGLKQ